MKDLVTRLRALADKVLLSRRDDVALLREAADALDRLHHSRVPTGSLMNEVRDLEQERDALTAKLAETESKVAGCDARIAQLTGMLDHHAKRALEQQERAAKAEAEAAALREALSSIVRLDPSWERRDQLCREALSQPGPGAALAERVKKLERVLGIANQLGCRITAEGGHGLPVHALVLDLAEALAALEEKPC